MQEDHRSGSLPLLPSPNQFDLLRIFESLHQGRKLESLPMMGQNQLLFLQSQLRKRPNPFFDSKNPSKALKFDRSTFDGSQRSNQTNDPKKSHDQNQVKENQKGCANHQQGQNLELQKPITSSIKVIDLEEDGDDEDIDCIILQHQKNTAEPLVVKGTSKLPKTMTSSIKIINLEDDEDEDNSCSKLQHQKKTTEPLALKDPAIEAVHKMLSVRKLFQPSSLSNPRSLCLLAERCQLFQKRPHLQNRLKDARKKCLNPFNTEIKCVINIEDEDYPESDPQQKQEKLLNIKNSSKKCDQNMQIKHQTVCSEESESDSELTESEIPTIGPDYQAKIFPFELNRAGKRRFKKPLKLVWSPESIERETLTSFIVEIQNITRKREVNEEQALKILKDFNFNIEAALAIIKRNRFAYKNLLQIRTQASSKHY